MEVEVRRKGICGGARVGAHCGCALSGARLLSDVILSRNGKEQCFVQRSPDCYWEFIRLCNSL
jgi:hypothetical protein